MRVGTKLAELLVKNGVDYVFGVPGGQTLPLYDGIRALNGQIRHVLMRDERSAGFAADAYARMTGRTGVCDATVGPGATNLLSPLAEALCSSIPLVAIVSDIARAWEHRRMKGNASQGIEQLSMFKPVSKWQVTLTDPKSLENVMDTAFRIATTGKPGPVVISVPDDVAGSDFPFRDTTNTLQGAVFPRFRSAPDPEAVDQAVDLLRQSKKPVVLAGGGAHIAGAGPVLKTLVEKLQIPVITTISGKGIIEETHPLAFGVTGSFGNPVANELMMAADLVFYVGCKVGQLTTLNYRVPKKSVPVIHLDADPEEIGRNFIHSIPLLADAKLGLQSVDTAIADIGPKVTWDFSAYKAKHQRWYAHSTQADPQPGNPLRPQTIMGIVDKALTDSDLIVCDASLSSGWAASYLNLKSAGRRFMAPRGLAGLGWGAPAAIGATMAANGKSRAFCFAGDGGFSYSMQELEVMKRFNLPVVNVVLNNDVLGWIKHVQRDFYKEKYISTDFTHVDFATVAKGFGVRSYSVQTAEELAEALTQEAAPDGPALIDVISDQWESPILRT